MKISQISATIITALLLLTSCEGAFDWVYDEAPATQAVAGQMYIDASNWKTWHYIDLNSVRDSLLADSTYDASRAFVSYPIPMDASGDETTTAPGQQLTGQYMYWFDVFGEGIKKNTFTSFTPTAEQQAPDTWTIAIHRNNVRTNPATVVGVWESSLTDIAAVTPTLYSNATFTADEWSENEVWDDQAKMLLCYVPSQGIAINKVLSGWLTMEIPPMPPAFSHNNHVFILRLTDGTYAALQLVDYMSATGTKCCLTIKYRYPIQ